MRRQRRPTPLAWPSALLPTLLLAFLTGLIAAACNATPTNTPNGSSSAGPTDVPGTSAEPGGSAGEPSQTDTDWGRIWDALPPTFPTPPDSMPSEPIGRGPSSGDLSVGAAPAEVAEFYDRALGEGGYVSSVQGPLEDGSFVVDATGVAAGCQVQVTVTPLSGVTHVTILFGAACPFR